MRATQVGQKEFGFSTSVHVVSVNDYLRKFNILSDQIHVSLFLLLILFHNTNMYGPTQVDQIIQKRKPQEKRTNKQKETNMGDGTRERLLYRIIHLKGAVIPLKTKVTIQTKPNKFGQLLLLLFSI